MQNFSVVIGRFKQNNIYGNIDFSGHVMLTEFSRVLLYLAQTLPKVLDFTTPIYNRRNQIS